MRKVRIAIAAAFTLLSLLLCASLSYAEEAQFTRVENGSDSYSLLYGGEEILSVQRHSLPYSYQSQEAEGLSLFEEGAALTETPSYFSATMQISEKYEAFISGLTANSLAELETKLIETAIEGNDFDITQLDFIDSEKLATDAEGMEDDNLCWAATASNMLYYSGWAAQAKNSAGESMGFSSPDDVFEAFIAAFKDAGGNIDMAMDWFFNGVYYYSNDAFKDPDAYSSGSTGGFLKDYAARSFLRSYTLQDPSIGINSLHNFHRALAALEDGRAAGLSVGWYDPESGERDGGHAITLWGYIRDKENASSLTKEITALIVSDSDSDKSDSTLSDRREAPNRYSLLHISPYCEFNAYYDTQFDSFSFDEYASAGTLGIIEDIVTLLPYSEDAQKESSLGAAAGNTALFGDNGKANLAIYGLEFYLHESYVRSENSSVLMGDMGDSLSTEDNFYVSLLLYNDSTLPLDLSELSGDFCEILIRDNNSGEIVKSSRISLSEAGLNAYLDPYDLPYFTTVIGGGADELLSEGSYTMEITLNPADEGGERLFEEAFYTDNSYLRSFSVGPAYSVTDSEDESENTALSAVLTHSAAEYKRGPFPGSSYAFKGFTADFAGIEALNLPDNIVENARHYDLLILHYEVQMDSKGKLSRTYYGDSRFESYSSPQELSGASLYGNAAELCLIISSDRRDIPPARIFSELLPISEIYITSTSGEERTLHFTASSDGAAIAAIFDSDGRLVQSFFLAEAEAGKSYEYELEDLSDAASWRLYELSSGSFMPKCLSENIYSR